MVIIEMHPTKYKFFKCINDSTNYNSIINSLIVRAPAAQKRKQRNNEIPKRSNHDGRRERRKAERMN